MKKSLILSVGLTCLLLMGGLSQAYAESKELTPAAIEQINLADKLTNYGIARKDPLLLIAAAQLLKSISMDPVAAQMGMSSDDILNKARGYAAKRQDLIGLIDDIAAAKTKGLCYGATTRYGCF